LNDYLCRRRVPGYLKPDCDCGWPRQTPKHVILFCPTQMTGQAEMLSEAKITNYTKLLSTGAGLRAVTRWFLQRDILTQFPLARTMDYAKPRRRGRKPGCTWMRMTEIAEARLRRTAASYCNIDSLAKGQRPPIGEEGVFTRVVAHAQHHGLPPWYHR
jgi:hypothetical protein